MSLFSSAVLEDVFVLPENATVTTTGRRAAGEPGTTRPRSASTTVPRQCVYLIGGQFGHWMSIFFRDVFHGVYTTNTHTGYWLEALNAPSFGNLTFDTVAKVINNMAKGATNMIRLNGKDSIAITPDRFTEGGSVLLPEDFSNETVSGNAIRDTVCYDMRLAWLAYPFASVAFSWFVVVAMVIRSYNLRKAGKPVWKASILPLLFNGIVLKDSAGENEGLLNGQDKDIRSMERRAQKMVVTLEERAGTYGFFVDQDSNYRALR